MIHTWGFRGTLNMTNTPLALGVETLNPPKTYDEYLGQALRRREWLSSVKRLAEIKLNIDRVSRLRVTEAMEALGSHA
jgi:hypothetical protein